MNEEQLIEVFRDLIHTYLHRVGGDVLYGETIQTSKGTFDVELRIIEYNND